MRKILLIIGLTSIVFGCSNQNNVLTEKEKRDGWILLFDGKTSAGWKSMANDSFPKAGWSICNGELCCNAGDLKESRNGGDIITTEQYGNFELCVDWKMITSGGNSGIKYLVQENLDSNNVKHGIGLEYQILDDENFQWMKEGKMKPGDFHTMGALYELYPCSVKHPKKLGEWNQSIIIKNGTHIEHWLNGEKILEVTLGTDDFRQRVSESKFKSIPAFGEWEKGYILLQDHGSNVCFRNIKIKTLK
jgi:hypothetical protein